MSSTLSFERVGHGPLSITIRQAVIAGWTGRDRAAVDHHIAELAAIGVPPPSEVPLFYRISAQLLTSETVIQVVDATSSGEVEPLLIDDGESLYLGLGSDHTDRELESHSVALSKQVCAKPVATTLWDYRDVRDHLDDILLRSFVRDDPAAEWTAYQDGGVAKIRPLDQLIAACPFAAGDGRLEPGTAMMCGTLGVLSGGVRPARFFRMEMHDPVLDRTLVHEYETASLPAVK